MSFALSLNLHAVFCEAHLEARRNRDAASFDLSFDLKYSLLGDDIPFDVFVDTECPGELQGTLELTPFFDEPGHFLPPILPPFHFIVASAQVNAVEQQCCSMLSKGLAERTDRQEQAALQGRTGSKTGGYQSEKGEEKRAHRGSHTANWLNLRPSSDGLAVLGRRCISNLIVQTLGTRSTRSFA